MLSDENGDKVLVQNSKKRFEWNLKTNIYQKEIKGVKTKLQFYGCEYNKHFFFYQKTAWLQIFLQCNRHHLSAYGLPIGIMYRVTVTIHHIKGCEYNAIF